MKGHPITTIKQPQQQHRNSSTNKSKKCFGTGISWAHMLSFLFGCCIATFCLNIFHATILNLQHDMEHFSQDHLQQPKVSSSSSSSSSNANNNNINNNNMNDPKQRPNPKHPSAMQYHPKHDILHSMAGLDCTEHGGPNDSTITQELVYWKDLPLDNDYTSPFYDSTIRRYLTFEPDGGGWNNIRMSMETVLGMAIATGRVLVLPPSQHMYLLGQDTFSFADFFPLHSIAQEHVGLEIITMNQFLQEIQHDSRIKMKQKKNINNKNNNNNDLLPLQIPDNNRFDWDGDTNAVKSKLNPFLQSIAENPDWDPVRCMAAFPQSTDPKDVQALRTIHQEILQQHNMTPPLIDSFINHPTPVNGTTKQRMMEFMANRKKICIYDESLQQAPIIHFHGKQKLGARLLVHFYAFLFFQNYHDDLWMKRFVRDHVRYIDQVQCAAARVLHAVRQHAKENNPTTNIHGVFDSFHIRRGDFQYKKTRISALEIWNRSQHEIPQGTTVYIGTDERKKAFFDPMKEYGHWDLLFLDDFMHLLDGINTNYYGMIDQLVASRGRTFFGCWFSTFTGYITRLRGYHSQNEIMNDNENENDNNDAKAYQMGLLPHSYYYALPEHKTKLHDYWPIKLAFYPREFPVSWRDLDFDLDIHGDEANH